MNTQNITKNEAWELLSSTENSLLGASGTHTLDEIIEKLQVFHGDTFSNARTIESKNGYRIKFSDGSTLYKHDYSKAFKYGDYLILMKDNDSIIYQTF